MGASCCKAKTKEPPAPPSAPKPAPKPAAPKEPTKALISDKDNLSEAPREMAPLTPRTQRIQELEAGRACPFQHPGKCDVEGGEVRAAFAEGLVFRIIKDDVWYIYNDTLDYDAHVNYRFGPGSEITAGERTSLEVMENGWTCAHAVVHPLETVLYISGTHNGFKSDVTAVPLTEEYRRAITSGPNAIAAEELMRVERLGSGETDDEALLRLCVENKVPFVDVSFPPTSEMLYREKIDGRTFPEMAMQRPTQYLPPDMRNQSDALRGAVVPQSVNHGHLGDCWLMCSAAIMAECEPAVQDIFSNSRPEERAVGGYRVALSKCGWWRSVIVDNYLPTISNTPVFGRITDDPRELWVSLYQKAYAKVHGSYASITGGDSLQALQDLTGAPLYRFDKEWEAASSKSDDAFEFVEKLIGYTKKGYTFVLNTPGHDSSSYLGLRRDGNPEAFKAAYKQVGLRAGYTYYVVDIDVCRTASGAETAVFKVRNPQASAEEILNAPAWDRSAATLEMRAEAAARNIMCVAWEEAINYFDGGGVVYTQHNSTDYRMQGWFDETHPNFALEVTASEPVEVMLVLSQPDKRGISMSDPQSRYAPIMLSVSQADDEGMQRVQMNTSWDAECPSADYNFVVARDVAMKYTFQPSYKPYMVIPRIHRKGVKAGYVRQFVLGIITSAPLDGKLNIELKQINKECNVFKNISSFVPENMFTVETEYQVHRFGSVPTNRLSSAISSAVPPKRPTPIAKSSSESEVQMQFSEEASSMEAADRQIEPEEVSIHPDERSVESASEDFEMTAVTDEQPAAEEAEEQPAKPVDSDEESL